MPMLELEWWQAKIVREQIEAAEEGLKLGREGTIVMDSGCDLKWDTKGITIEVPEEVPLQDIESTRRDMQFDPEGSTATG